MLTYEELLAKINEELATNYEDECGNIPIGLDALRAIVELHKPHRSGGCDGCGKDWGNNAEPMEDWPCPTIQAMEKEFQ